MAGQQHLTRRELLRHAALLGLGSHSATKLLAASVAQPAHPQAIHTVLLVAKCHLDVGFTKTQAKVVRQYFDTFFPQAIELAAAQRAAGQDHYTWTTGSWLLYEYLEQADTGQRRAAEHAIAAHDLAWHGLPFNWQTEMLDRSMIEGSMAFSRTLDARFGLSTTGAKMTDVPGHSRGIVAPLADAGIRLLNIGVNAASTPPEVPDLFLWKEPSGRSVAMMYHHHDYGGIVEVPGTGIAVDVEVRNDNSGPHTPAEVAAIYTRLRTRYPGATIQAATLNDVAAAVDKVRDRLPVVTGEIGDTWIYGCASDPVKVAQYRSLARLRRDALAGGTFHAGDPTDRNLLRHLLLAPEHTWGTDTKSYLDNAHYRPADLAAVLGSPGYVTMETSWKEKRQDVAEAAASLPASLHGQVAAAFSRLTPQAPDIAGLAEHDPATPISTRHFDLQLDPATGAIIGLTDRKTHTRWAAPDKPLALFTYETLSSAQYAAYIKRYLTVETEWGPRDFGKPGIENAHAESREWHPRVVHCHTVALPGMARVVLQLAFADPAAEQTGNIAWPRQIFLDLRFPDDTPSVALQVVTLGKVPNRLPEALWLTFSPAGIVPGSWLLSKVDQPVRPEEVVAGGGRNMHAVSGDVSAKSQGGQRFRLRTEDAPVIALGERSPLNFSRRLPDMAKGLHVSLFNNAWGTNYPQWSGGDWLYRFQLSL